MLVLGDMSGAAGFQCAEMDIWYMILGYIWLEIGHIFCTFLGYSVAFDVPSTLMQEVHVALPSGYSQSFSVLPHYKVEDLRISAQGSFGQNFLRLVFQGQVLEDLQLLQDVGLKDGDHLTAIAQEIQVASTSRAFALWYAAGNRFVTWGHNRSGGDMHEVHHLLMNVQEVASSLHAFAAVLTNGHVITWGHLVDGPLQKSIAQLQVKRIRATDRAFAAILEDGSVVAWGHDSFGADTSKDPR